MTRVLDKVEGSQSIEPRGTEGARGPFFSWMAGKWASSPPESCGGRALTGARQSSITAAEELLGASWGDDDVIVAALSTAGLGVYPRAEERLKPFQARHLVRGGRRCCRVPERCSSRLEGTRRCRGTARRCPVIDRREDHEAGPRRQLRQVPGERASGVGRPANAVRRAIQPRSAAADRSRSRFINDIALNMHNSAEFDASQTGTFVCRCGPGRRRLSRPMARSVWGCSAFAVRAIGVFRATAVARRVAHCLRHGSQWRSAGPSHCRSAEPQDSTLGEAGPSRPVWTPHGRFLVSVGASGEVRWMKTDGSTAGEPWVPLVTRPGFPVPSTTKALIWRSIKEEQAIRDR